MNALPGTGEAVRVVFHTQVQAGYVPTARARLQHWLDGVDMAGLPDVACLPMLDTTVSRDPALPAADSRLPAFHAPLGLMEGAWLARVARPETGHRAAVAELFAAYLALLGDDEGASPATAYRGWLARAGHVLPPVYSWQFSRDPRIGLPALAFASLHLELGSADSDLLAERIGFSLAYALSDSPWRLPALAPQRRLEVLAEMARRARTALGMYLDEADAAEAADRERRVLRGYALYRQGEARYRTALDAYAASEESPAERVAAIFRRKAPFAHGYHRAAKLGGRSLDAWFGAKPFDAQGFLNAFAVSDYVSGEAGQRYFDRLTDFGGPMFGIFSPEERLSIANWLAAVRAGTPPVATVPAAQPEEAVEPEFVENPTRPMASVSTRDWFHALLHREGLPGIGAPVEAWVERQLRKAGQAIAVRRSPRRRFFDYSPEALEDWVAAIHRDELARYRPFSGKPRLQREEYVFGIRQLAPAILVDGCWLQGACSAAQQDDRLHRLLFHIYADELGAGRREWNHPAVYRQLLQQAGIDLPEVSAPEFAQDPGFLDAAFDLPVFLLGISRCPGRWLPELLGLNLAIELSGLGAQYLSLADELEYWGLDPLIVRLHQSIDSLAGGHAAWATEAVQLHLERVRALGGAAAVTPQWRRVWCGYRSLDTVTRRFRRALVLAFCRRFLPGRWLRGLRSALG